MKILCLTIVVCSANQFCSVSRCLVCQTTPKVFPHEACQPMLKCCQKIKQALSAKILLLKKSNLLTSEKLGETGTSRNQRAPENDEKSMTFSDGDISIPEFMEFLEIETRKVSSLHLLIFSCVFICFLFAVIRYLSILRQYWSIY